MTVQDATTAAVEPFDIPDPVSTLTPMQEYLFDLNGYLVLKGAISPEDVAAMNATYDAIAAAGIEGKGWFGRVGVNASADRPVSFLDALFTSTSAACVTGLSVRSTPHDFSLFGQVVVLALIQLGGIGIITVTTFLTLRFGGRESLRQKAVIASTLGGADYDMRWVLKNVYDQPQDVQQAFEPELVERDSVSRAS